MKYEPVVIPFKPIETETPTPIEEKKEANAPPSVVEYVFSPKQMSLIQEATLGYLLAKNSQLSIVTAFMKLAELNIDEWVLNTDTGKLTKKV